MSLSLKTCAVCKIPKAYTKFRWDYAKVKRTRHKVCAECQMRGAAAESCYTNRLEETR